MARLLSVRREGDSPPDAGFPFSVPAVRALTALDLSAPVTFFVGENGSGKSTLLEAIAAAAGLPTLGAAEVGDDPTLEAQRRLASSLRLAWSRRTRQGFFLRAEDFFGFARRRARLDARVHREALEAGARHRQRRARTGSVLDDLAAEDEDDVPTPGVANTDAGDEHPDEVAAREHIARYDARSHGESFLETFRARVTEDGLYLLDEPESPLSPSRQLTLLALIAAEARAGAQFVIATHSPILLALPGARIYSFDETPVREARYEELEHVLVTRDFLAAPARFLKHLLDPGPGDGPDAPS